MNEIKVSVIIPSLNVVDYISNCIESVINQTLKDIEIICIDAGSTDGTYEILKNYASQDKRIKLLTSDKKSYGYQVNTGINIAIGEYIGIVESDDIINLSMFEELYDKANSSSANIVKADFGRFVIQNKEFKLTEDKICKSNPSLYNKILTKSDFNNVIQDAQLYIWAGIYKLSFLKKHNIQCNESAGASYQDNGFWFLTMSCAERIVFIDKVFYMLRRDNPNSSFYKKDKIYVIFDEYNFIKNELLRLGIFSEVEKYFYNAYCGAVRWHYRRIADDFKKDFLQKWKSEFNEIWNTDAIDENIFSKNLYNDLRLVITNPNTFINKEKRLTKRQSKRKSLFNKIMWSFQDRGIKRTIYLAKEAVKKSL